MLTARETRMIMLAPPRYESFCRSCWRVTLHVAGCCLACRASQGPRATSESQPPPVSVPWGLQADDPPSTTIRDPGPIRDPEGRSLTDLRAQALLGGRSRHAAPRADLSAQVLPARRTKHAWSTTCPWDPFRFKPLAASVRQRG